MDNKKPNWYQNDPIMQRYFRQHVSHLTDWGEERLYQIGEYCAGPMEERARYTDRDGAPKLIRYNRQGEEINEIWYNEGYLQTVGDCYEWGVVGWRYREDVPCKIPFFYTQLIFMLMSKAEVGFTCPVTLTMSVAFVIEKYATEEQRKELLPHLASMNRETLHQGATFLTEIQGGSDVGSVTTKAVKHGEHYLLTGEKWFASNCDADGALILARIGETPGTKGLSLFYLPNKLQDGSKNRISIRRLKDKLGVRAVASGELVLQDAVGYLIGEEQEGFKLMAEALNVSRMCTSTGSLAISQRAFSEVLTYVTERQTFGNSLISYPMIRESLLNMMVDIEASWTLVAQMLLHFDRVHTTEEDSPAAITLLRCLLAMAKVKCSEQSVLHAKEVLEMHGGNGYIEEYVTPRLLRDAQVNTVWEGATNIMALEFWKNMNRNQPDSNQNILLHFLSSILNEISLPAHTEEREIAWQELQKVSNQFDYLAQADLLTQQAHALHFLTSVTQLTCTILLMQQAEYGWKQGETRMIKVAKYYCNRAYRPDLYDIGSSCIPSVEYFDEIVMDFVNGTLVNV
ncbi:alkylation response protein AidB-like acyl-CoA dehydrogenase [Croceifilum oryzae]|uniref:Alkylation response protein AidB-like acyl-CoA dehydrogenase n=1 Tax=Croceifilum oryzae TaxID=1553429 RepID=A0AAJ1WRV7_9BACL|nr:acyl-CoA dehydrogenase family protein [Croceifilum oryzae]MDQ0416398.1 alkylation response protein AidB-like acyl-CoA dehydrogenase [Croceifilum oryzae]